MRSKVSTPALFASVLENLEPRLMLSADSPPLVPGIIDEAPQALMVSAFANEPLAAEAALPLSPAVVDTITATGAVRKIYVFGSLAFAVGDWGIQIASVSTPQSPVVLSTITTSASVTAITVANGALYVGLSGGKLAIYNINNPSLPLLAGQMTVPSALGGTVTIKGMAFLANTSWTQPYRLYLACMNEGVKVIDVTTPATPTLLGGGSDGTNAMDVAIVGPGTGGWAQNALAVIMGDNVKLMEVTDPANPTVGSVRAFSSPYKLFVDNTKLYVSDSVGLHLVNATSFTNPVIRGVVHASPAAGSKFYDLAVPIGGQLAYFSQVGLGVTIVDGGAAGGPAVVGTYDNSAALGVAAYGTTLYVADGDATWLAVDTGVSRDLTVTNTGAAEFFAAPGKSINIAVSVNNLGNLALMGSQGVGITAYFSIDGTFNSTCYQLTPVTYVNDGIAALTDLAKTLKMHVPGNVPAGNYYLILKLTGGGAANGDLTNDLWISPAASVHVLKGKPTVTLALDGADDSGAAGDNITNISPVLLTGTTRANCNVVLKRGSTVLGTTTSAADGSFSFADIALMAGKNNLIITSTDQAGNKGTLTRKIVLDTAVAASSLSLHKSTDSGKAGDWLTKVPAVKLAGKTEKGASVALLVGGVEVATAVAGANGTFSFTGVSLSEGANSVVAQITDVAGNTTSVTKTVTLDTSSALPTLAFDPASDTGTPGDNITSLPKVTLTGTAEPGAKVDLKILKGFTYGQVATTRAAADGTFTFYKVSLKLGANNFGVFATDLAGNLASTTGLVVTYQPA